MANLQNRLRGVLYALYDQGKGMPKADDPQHLYIHSTRTLQAYLGEADPYARWLREHGVKSRATTEEAAKHVQVYLDDLQLQGKSAAYIHLAAAAVSKALGVPMTNYRRPRRTASPQRGRTPAHSLRGRRSADMTAPEHQRLVAFAAAVGLRRAEYAALRGRDLVEIDGHWYVHVVQGKGGREQYQLIADQDVPLVRSYFSGLGPDDPVFQPEELHNKLNLHSLRREHAQTMYAYYKARLDAEPKYRQRLIQLVKDAYTRGGKDWRKSKDVRRLDSPYIVRGNIRRDFRDAGQEVRLDRLALLAVNTLHLAHYRCDVGVAFYLR